MKINEKTASGVPNDRNVLKEEILKCIDSMDTERVKLLYVTAKIWEGKPE